MELQIFKNEQFGEVRMVVIEEQPWLVGKDVAEALGYSNTKDALKKHVDDEDKQIIQRSQFATLENYIPKSALPVDFVRGDIPNRGLTVINESGLYSLILSSKLPQAKQFKRWVTSEVLPSIRKHGLFATDELLDNPDFAIATLQKLKEEREAKRILQEQNEVLAFELRETKPKAEYYDLMLANKGLIKTSEIAKNYGRSAQSFNKLLNKLKVIYKQGDTWLPYAKYQTHNYVQLEPFAYKNSKGRDDVKMRTKWTMKGHIFLYELLKKHGILPLIEQDITDKHDENLK
ncbi:TPA: phage antirepressor KilAC domain-containing protein [Streptococcus suis]|uniref:phage antirepressor KilAC domain-containing protein n=1 Tax=Streptococcus suis TaxID=1307 RepID=UPI002AAD7B8C|nr:phage antirepressor KilAC domain-containing protein [Streptococcus suis]MDY7596239.1 BRO family protein [Streptococcus suis]HEM6121071.1 phage antirepressor KilAC domain-containing protein [Streptococcus suis]HEM6237003.1 phage antirepressor KilAC domain-containing protein [Streptococcus suis]HEM6242080.1 phage antirepressor KilAC domain-containing protein [Streptococcus suis]HEM6261042.1 phage antirepressor KilAC domain-containing protein [Streptococcus suis]